MIPKDAFFYWYEESGVRDHIAELSTWDPESIEERLHILYALGTADQVRTALSNAEKVENTRCALYLLSGVLQTDFENPNLDRDLALLEWELLIANYSDETVLLTAHGELLKGMLLHNAGRLADARDAYRAALEAIQALGGYPVLLSVCLFCTGRLLANLDRIDDAESYFERALAHAPRGSGWRQMLIAQKDRAVRQDECLGQMLARASHGEWKALLERNRSVIDDDFNVLAFNRMRRLSVQGEYKQAEKAGAIVDALAVFQGAEPGFHINRLALAAYYKESHLFPQAERMIRVLRQEGGTDDALELELADCLVQQGKREEGKEVLKALLQSNPKHAQAHSHLGVLYATEEQWSLAEQHLETALQLDPEDAMAKQFLESIPKASVSFDPESGTMTIGGDISSAPPGAMAEMMLAAIIAGSPDKAEELLKAVAEDKGADVAQRVAAMAFGGSDTQPATHLQKAEKLFAARKLPEAIEEYKLAIAENPEEWQAYMGLGDTYYMMGDFHTAAAYFEESLAIQPFAPTFRYLGDAYMHTGQLDKAIGAYQSSVETDPNYAPAKRALQHALQRKRGR